MPSELQLQPVKPTSRQRAARATESSCSPGWGLHAGTVFVCLLANATLEIAKADGHYTGTWWTFRGLEILGVAGSAAWFHRYAVRHRVLPAVSPILIALVLANLAWAPLERAWLDSGRPLEVLIIDSLKWLVLGQAVAAFWETYRRLAIVCSLFLVLFGSMLSYTPLVHGLVGVYALAAIGWLAATYWESLRERLLATTEKRHPGRMLIGVVGGLTLLLFAAGVTNRRAIQALPGFLPSSGGTGSSDPFARGGVGDGDLLVAGSQNIKSFAPIEDAPFVEDHRPGLYDVINDVAGKPRKIPPRSGLRVAVPPELAVKLKRHLETRTEQAAREFSTLRQATPPDERRIHDIDSDAVLYVAGRTPLHLRMATYAIYDGVDWHPEPPPDPRRAPQLEVVQAGGRPWLRLGDNARWAEFLAAAETHAVKPVRLGSSVIPSPPHLHGVHIALVDQPHFYGWAGGGLIRMQRDELPSGVPIHLASRGVDYATIAAAPERHRFLSASDEYQFVPDAIDRERLRATAEEWTRGLPRGWPQVDAVIQRLRSEYRVDRTATPAGVDESPVTQFLYGTRCGPDYLFATSAALLLRSIGYSTRLVSGFFVPADKFDSRLRHTPVHAGDLHFWIEAHVGAGEWITLEPTPGYTPLGPPPGYWQRICEAAAGVLSVVRAHAGSLTALLLVGAVLWVRRLDLIDGIATVLWSRRCENDARRTIAETWRLVERRLRWRGWRRPPGMTVREWLPGLSVDMPEATAAASTFLPALEWAAFAPPEAEAPVTDPRGACRRLLKACRLRRLPNPRTRDSRLHDT